MVAAAVLPESALPRLVRAATVTGLM